ncbi:MAG: hypothetical protein Q7R33_04945 [Nitrosarchaeum sp.]|nr:hypothetical protein [Nitrosarchaeum sp.]
MTNAWMLKQLNFAMKQTTLKECQEHISMIIVRLSLDPIKNSKQLQEKVDELREENLLLQGDNP